MVTGINITPTPSNHPPNPKALTPPSSSQRHQQGTNQPRPPLLPSSERDNGVVSKRAKSKEITSRYMSSSSSSKRSPSPSPSPLPSKSLSATPLRRAQSVERSRPSTPRPNSPLPISRPGNAGQVQPSAASKILLSSTRSLSVSFQGESYSLPISKVKAAPAATISRASTPERRKVTPLRGRVEGGKSVGGDQGENFRPMDQHRWPGRSRQQPNPLTRSMDCTVEKSKIVGSAGVSRVLKQSLIDLDRRASLDARLNPKLGRGEISKTVQLAVIGDPRHGSVGSDEVLVSDTDSVSSGSNASSQELSGIANGRSAPRGISVPARFWQETNSRLRRLQDPGSPLSRSPGSKAFNPSKFNPLKKTSSDILLSSPRNIPMSRTMSSPLRGPGRPASPSRLVVPPAASPARGTPSPSRTRGAPQGSGGTPLNNTPSILSFVVDSRRGKIGENRIVDAHLLRLWHNRQLQWRFVNARVDALMFVKRLTIEKNLYNAWVTTSELHDSITIKRIKLQLLRQNLKLTSILKGQMVYFKEWALLDRDYSISLSGAVEALEASTLRLPVVSGAKADIQNVMDAIGSAVSVMQAMVSSLYSLLSKVEEVNLLIAELSNATAEERALILLCRDNLSVLSAMQVKDCSLRTHILQLKRVSTTS